MQPTSIKLEFANGNVISIKPSELQVTPAESDGVPFTALMARDGRIIIAGFNGTFVPNPPIEQQFATGGIVEGPGPVIGE